jgi:hypothetical protein
MHIVLIKTIKCYNNTNKKQVRKHDMCNAYTMENPPIINQNICWRTILKQMLEEKEMVI